MSILPPPPAAVADPAADPAAAAVPPERVAVAQRNATRVLTLQRELQQLQHSDDRLSRGRALGFMAVLGLVGLALFAPQPWSWPAVAGASAVFLGLVMLHVRVASRQHDLRQRVAFVEQSQARIRDVFRADAKDAFRRGDAFVTADHPYAGDLDIFGGASLFEQLNVANTHEGARRLAGWLHTAADVAQVLSRQQAAQELAAAARLREDLAVSASRARKLPADGAAFLTWAEQPASFAPRGKLLTAAALLLVAVATVLGGLAFMVGGAWVKAWGAAVLLQLVVSVAVRARTEPVIAPVTVKQSPLEQYQAMFALVEGSRFEGARLQGIVARLHHHGQTASQLLQAVERWTGLAAVRHNVLGYVLFQTFFLWDIWCAYQLDRWRARYGRSARGWLEALAEFEALTSLATFADEHPDFVWPTLVAAGPLYRAVQLGHPLIAAAKRVDNDVTLDDDVRALMVTGSNMSGKSTMLRSMGINAVLAQAGAPVCANSFEMSPLRVHTSMRVSDALDQGASHFFMEVRKLKAVVDAVNNDTGRVLFLLDEVLHGTNSRERNIGAKAVVQHLVERRAVGAVSSHDLGLVALEKISHGRVINKHFEDHIEAGVMRFDYRMKEGPVATSNALRLMRAVGIDVAGLDG